MKIAFVRPHYKGHIITPPLGLGYLSSYLNKFGIKTVLIDGPKERFNTQRMIKEMVELKPDAMAITCLTAFYNEFILLRKFYLRPEILFKLIKLLDHRQIIYLINRIKAYRLL